MATIEYNNLPDSFEPASKKDEVRLTPLAEGSIKVQKESGWKKARKVLFAETADNAVKYLMSDVFVPALIDFLAGGSKKFIDYIFYGGTANGKTTGPKASYTAYYQSGNKANTLPSRQVPLGEVEIVAFATEMEAEKTLNEISAFIERYGALTYDRFKDFTGRNKDISYTDKYLGWTSLKGSSIHRISDPEFRWALEMPPLERVE